MRNEVLRQLAKKEPGFQPDVIFDVGANVGQSLTEFRRYYPESAIYAFEPVAASFEALQSHVEEDERANAFHLGLSRTPGELTMTANGTSAGNHVTTGARGDVETVAVETGDAFCKAQGIESIEFLKIDTEGHDADVLIGFSDMLRAGRIEFVQVECSFSPDNTYHVAFSRLSELLYSFGYGLHDIFGLKRRRPRLGTRRGALFGDAVFVRDDVLES
jgi:FkbM family methyltransferase